MKLYIVVILCLTAQSYADHSASSEEDSKQTRNFDDQRETDLNLNTDPMNDSSHYWQSSASSLPEATSYKIKVTRRINNSSILSDMRERLYKMADEKLEKCMKPNDRELDRHCVGRVTGQMMQLIASVENPKQHMSHTSHSHDHRKPVEMDY